jgi:putative NADH-flavin reductase
MENQSLRLFILGATGGTGRQLVNQALNRNHRVTAFVRSPHKLGPPRDGLAVIQGNILDVNALAAALPGHDAVLSALGAPGPAKNTIVSESAGATVAAMKAAGLRRLLLVGVAVLFPNTGVLASLLRNTLLRNIAIDHAEMERIVKASGLDWTIARPPRLTNGPCRQRYGITDDQLPPGSGGGAASISRADVAHFLLNEVEHTAHLRRIVGIAYTRSSREITSAPASSPQTSR